MEMHLFVTMVIRMFDLEIQDPVPQPVGHKYTIILCAKFEVLLYSISESSTFGWSTTAHDFLQSTIQATLVNDTFIFFLLFGFERTFV